MIEIINYTNKTIENTSKLQEFFKGSVEFGQQFEDTRPGLMGGGCQDVNLSSHFGFCDDYKIEVILCQLS